MNCNCDGNTKEIKNFDDFGNSMFEQTNLMLLSVILKLLKRKHIIKT